VSAEPAVFRRAPYRVVCGTCAIYLESVGLVTTAEQRAAYDTGRRAACPRCEAPGTRCDRCLVPATMSNGRRCAGCGQVITP
jgi:hypothetical protein